MLLPPPGQGGSMLLPPPGGSMSLPFPGQGGSMLLPPPSHGGSMNLAPGGGGSMNLAPGGGFNGPSSGVFGMPASMSSARGPVPAQSVVAKYAAPTLASSRYETPAPMRQVSFPNTPTGGRLQYVPPSGPSSRPGSYVPPVASGSRSPSFPGSSFVGMAQPLSGRAGGVPYVPPGGSYGQVSGGSYGQASARSTSRPRSYVPPSGGRMAYQPPLR